MLIDGGTYANNPALCAYAEARQRDREAGVFLVSIGCGRHAQPIHYHPGLLAWAKPILDIVFFDGVSRPTEYQLQQLLPPVRGCATYYRFQPDLTVAGDAMDDSAPSSLRRLQQQAEELVQDRLLQIEEVCQRLVM